MGGAAYAEGDGRIERPHEPDILLRFMALAQQRAASQLLAPPQATVGDVSPVRKGLSKYLHLSGTRWFPSLSDSMPLERSLGLRHGSPAARHSTLWGVAQGGGTTWASWSAGLTSCRASWAAVANMAAGLDMEGKVNTALKERSWLILAV